MGEARGIDEARGASTRATILEALSALGLPSACTVLVHSSLSRIGWVAGGPHAVVLALLDAVGPDGTLVMPTHSGHLTDPAGWAHPPVPSTWWPLIRAETPAFDALLTPTRGMGAIVETFRHAPGVVRSSHPTSSFAAVGQNARTVVAHHELNSSLGEGSPLARLYELDAWVLLLGVGHANNTSLHLAEYRSQFPGKKSVVQGSPRLVDGVRRWVEYPELDFDDGDFDRVGKDFAATGRQAEGPVGGGTARLMRQRHVVDFAVEWFARNRLGPTRG